MKLPYKITGRWFDILFNPLVMAILIALAIIIFLPDSFDKYEVELIKSGT